MKTRAERAAYQRQYRKLNREKINAINRRYRQKNIERVRAWTVKSNNHRWLPTRPNPGRCESCGEIPRRTLHIDHCHTTETFRGWLCFDCNVALGALHDSVQKIRLLLAYAEKNCSAVTQRPPLHPRRQRRKAIKQLPQLTLVLNDKRPDAP